MKKLYTFLVVFVLAITAKSQTNSVYEQLAAVNKQWQFMDDADPRLKDRIPEPLTEVKLVQLHLRETEKLLRSRNTGHLSAQQKTNRARLLDILHTYWMNGVFPKNTFHKERRPYFIDIFNNYCAVGYLMKMSGADAMARDIHRTQNFSYLKDIRHPHLADWVKQSGFTVDELALIQPGYDCVPTAIVEMHYDNLGADVNEYIEIFSGNDFLQHFDKIEFYDHSGSLYKTVLKSSLPFYIVNVWSSSTHLSEPHSVYFYNFPSNESFADSGTVKLIRTSFFPGTVANLVYNSTGVHITLPSPFPIMHYSIFENGSGMPGNSLNFCSYSCSYNFVANILPASYGTINSSCLAILPLQLKSFDYTILNNKIQLTWLTASEINTDKFEIEKSSDGISFSKIGSVNAAVNSSGTRYYDFLDATPAITNYYRLRQVDRDGKFVYSKILLARLKINSPLVVYTPTVSTILRVGINLNQQDIQKVHLYELSGRGTGTGFAFRAGLNEIDVSKLTPGVYFLRLETRKGERFGEKFIKQ